MKHILLLLTAFLAVNVFAQNGFKVIPLSLPAEMAWYDHQFSGLVIHGSKLLLLSESRVQDGATALMYAIRLSHLEKKMKDTSFSLPFEKFLIHNLSDLYTEMKNRHQEYEGLEAVAVTSNDIYFSVETTTPSDSCYLLKGAINDTAIVLQNNFLLAVPKPVDSNGAHIYNASYESIAIAGKQLYSFFEYNYFGDKNFVRAIALPASIEKGAEILSCPIEKLPFRITDVTPTIAHHFTGINYFFKGGGKDEVYRVPLTDTVNDNLIHTATGYRNYCRLVDIACNGTEFTWKPLWQFPEEYTGYNWEGIAAYKKGYFLINDKYSPSKPYVSILIYLQKEK